MEEKESFAEVGKKDGVMGHILPRLFPLDKVIAAQLLRELVRKNKIDVFFPFLLS